MTLARGSIVDTALELEDGAAAITATEVNSGGILDLGDANFHGEVMLALSAMDATTGDETYDVQLQGSTSASFASGIRILASRKMGDATQLGDEDVDTALGIHRLPFNNEHAGTIYRYVRLKVVISGTTPSITYTAFIGKPIR